MKETRMSKIRIFLGAYINFPNAQNVNCENIAKYLDKDKFEVHTMYSDKIPIDKSAYKKYGIHLHRLLHNRITWKLSKYLVMLCGRYDIYYLPKYEDVDCNFVVKHKNGAVFLGSVEGVVGEQIAGTDESVRSKYLIMDDVFSISECVKGSVKKYWGYDSELLYLGVVPPNESEILLPKHKIKSVIWVGSIIDRKRPEYFVECARHFPDIKFTMIGDGNRQEKIKTLINECGISNINLTGRIQNKEVYNYLKKADLLLMTSDKEGLPKVIGEGMICRVPAIYINECYQVDYIQDGVNGYAVPNLDAMIEKIQYLIDNPTEYEKLSVQAFRTIQAYTWDNLIKHYEEYFIEQYHRKRG